MDKPQSLASAAQNHFEGGDEHTKAALRDALRRTAKKVVIGAAVVAAAVIAVKSLSSDADSDETTDDQIENY